MSIGIVGALRILASQSPTRPPRSVASSERVERTRHARVPVTWIDQHKASRGVVVHLHGGMHLRRERAEHWAWLEEVARRADVAAALVHHPLPPRSPFPRGHDAIIAALRAMEGEELLPAGRWALSGDESGGGLALGVARELADLGGLVPAMLLLSTPWVDLGEMGTTADLPGRRQAAAMYAGSVPRLDGRISPLHGDLAGLPPMHLTAAADDPLRADVASLHEGVLAAGGDSVLHEGPGRGQEPSETGEVFPLERSTAAAQVAWRAQIAALREGLGVRTHS